MHSYIHLYILCSNLSNSNSNKFHHCSVVAATTDAAVAAAAVAVLLNFVVFSSIVEHVVVCVFVVICLKTHCENVCEIKCRCNRNRCNPLWPLPYKILHLAHRARCQDISFAD